jgi:hypothetical protein
MTLLDNLKSTALPTGLFFALSLPQVYGQTNKLVGSDRGACPDHKTRLLHTVAFFALIYLSMKHYGNGEKTPHQLVACSLRAALLLFFFSSTEMFSLTDNLVGRVTPSFRGRMGGDNCPTPTGVVVHSLIFWLVLSWLVNFRE